jgi:prevent-host-death family protein
MTEAKNDICRIIREAEKDQVLIMRHGKPAAVVIGFQDDDDWFDYRLEHDEAFLRKIAKAREEIKQGKFVSLDKLPD